MPSTATDISAKFQVIIPETVKPRRPSCLTSERRVTQIVVGVRVESWVSVFGNAVRLNIFFK